VLVDVEGEAALFRTKGPYLARFRPAATHALVTGPPRDAVATRLATCSSVGLARFAAIGRARQLKVHPPYHGTIARVPRVYCSVA